MASMLAISSGVSSRTNRAGTPAQSCPDGTVTPMVTMEPGATMACVSTTELSSTEAAAPMTHLSLSVHAWIVVFGPTVTLAPMCVGASPWILATCTMERSPMLEFGPMVMLLTSPRTTAPYQIDADSATDTLPSTVAVGATNTVPWSLGCAASNATTRVDGFRCSKYGATSRAAPNLSTALPAARMAPPAALMTASMAKP
mmetsp:Transcript_18392/g.56173  ORF Transcript_18392/g.56173 Transcript_18392/m.56173 type:complete len:200 (+) Transcript_18392:579-1178(+)